MRQSTIFFLAAIAQAAVIRPRQAELVTPEKLIADVSTDKLLQRAKELQDIATKNGGNRQWRGQGYRDTLKWIETALNATNAYDINYQNFDLARTVVNKIKVTTSDGSKLDGVQGFNGGKSGTVTGQMVYVPNFGCEEADFPEKVKGKIALVERGTCTQGAKNALAQKAGAVGVISYNNENAAPEQPTLGNARDVKVDEFLVSAFASRESGMRIAKKVQGGAKIKATIESDVEIQRAQTFNLCAETKGGNHNAVILAGAHSDSVRAGAGINDNGSGTISQLEVALALAKYEVKNAIRWCWWTAEEDGLLGSSYYTRNLKTEEAAKIAMNLNFDMLASGNYALFVYDGDGNAFGRKGPAGSDQIEKVFTDYFTSINEKSVPTAFDGRSDYSGFIKAGIPAGGLFTGAEGRKKQNEQGWFGGEAGKAYDSCYHSKCDNASALNSKGWTIMTNAISHIIARYAADLTGFPFPRTAMDTMMAQEEVVEGDIFASDIAKPVEEY